MLKKSKIIIGELEFLAVAWGVFLVVLFSALGEGWEVLVAGTSSDTINVSVSILDVISISSPSDVTLSPDILGTGISTGSAVWTVSNNLSADWELEVEAESAPAMNGNTDTIADYTETVSGVPEIWSVDSSDSEFGFSVSGDSSEAKYSNGFNFEGFSGSSKIKVAGGSGVFPPGGEDVTIHFKVEVGADRIQDPGNYLARITVTASTL